MGWGCISVPGQQPRSPVIVFNYENWIALFPQFPYLSEPQAQMYFDIATSYCRNDGFGPICQPALKTNMLNLLTAHIAQLFAPDRNGQNPSTLVGRISNASEGSVSVGMDYPSSPSAAWFNQTQFGASYWQLMLPFRTMRYVTGPTRNFQPWPFQ